LYRNPTRNEICKFKQVTNKRESKDGRVKYMEDIQNRIKTHKLPFVKCHQQKDVAASLVSQSYRNRLRE